MGLKTKTCIQWAAIPKGLARLHFISTDFDFRRFICRLTKLASEYVYMIIVLYAFDILINNAKGVWEQQLQLFVKCWNLF